jgi:hypothetical protein
LSIEQVLAEEAIALNGAATAERADDLRPRVTGQDARSRRTKKDADVRRDMDENPDEVVARKTFYRSLNKLNRAALSPSGGGIRRTTFCLMSRSILVFDADCDPDFTFEGKCSA